MIPGDHHHADPRPLALRHGVRNFRAQRIRQADQAHPFEADVVLDARHLQTSRQGRLRHAQHPQASPGHCGSLLAQHGAALRRQVAQIHHGLRRPLGGDDVAAFGIVMPDVRHRQQADLKLILTHQSPGGMQVFRSFQLDGGQPVERLLHRIVRADFTGQYCVLEQLVKRLGQITAAQALRAQFLVANAQCADDHAVFGQSAGLVHAQDRDFTQRFNRVEPARQYPVNRDAARRQRQEHDQYDREFLRQNAHRQRDAGEHAAGEIPAGEPEQHHQQNAQGNPDDCHAARQQRHFLLKWRGRQGNVVKRFADAPKFGSLARCGHAHDPLAAHNHRAGIQKIVASLFGHWLRFTGQKRLIGCEFMRLKQDAIRCDAIAFADNQNIIAHDFGTRDSHGTAIAHHQRARAGQIAQCAQSVVRAPFLKHRDQHDHQHETQKHQRFACITHGQVDTARAEQQQEHRFAQHFKDDHDQTAALAHPQLVGAVLGQPQGDRLVVQAHANLRVAFDCHSRILKRCDAHRRGFGQEFIPS